ncbi:hypothetical protein QVD99_006326 [Batrachochytrium dendrobatidis]|nr:hypothetical protein O5D80_003328 [Batrachochytrium dendrobatidis]KAK5667114.1 hypothetical protein QVD99_006326 [Batrachochytrium dendrobatidis]
MWKWQTPFKILPSKQQILNVDHIQNSPSCQSDQPSTHLAASSDQSDSPPPNSILYTPKELLLSQEQETCIPLCQLLESFSPIFQYQLLYVLNSELSWIMLIPDICPWISNTASKALILNSSKKQYQMPYKRNRFGLIQKSCQQALSDTPKVTESEVANAIKSLDVFIEACESSSNQDGFSAIILSLRLIEHCQHLLNIRQISPVTNNQTILCIISLLERLSNQTYSSILASTHALPTILCVAEYLFSCMAFTNQRWVNWNEHIETVIFKDTESTGWEFENQDIHRLLLTCSKFLKSATPSMDQLYQSAIHISYIHIIGILIAEYPTCAIQILSNSTTWASLVGCSDKPSYYDKRIKNASIAQVQFYKIFSQWSLIRLMDHLAPTKAYSPIVNPLETKMETELEPVRVHFDSSTLLAFLLKYPSSVWMEQCESASTIIDFDISQTSQSFLLPPFVLPFNQAELCDWLSIPFESNNVSIKLATSWQLDLTLGVIQKSFIRLSDKDDKLVFSSLQTVFDQIRLALSPCSSWLSTSTTILHCQSAASCLLFISNLTIDTLDYSQLWKDELFEAILGCGFVDLLFDLHMFFPSTLLSMPTISSDIQCQLVFFVARILSQFTTYSSQGSQLLSDKIIQLVSIKTHIDQYQIWLQFFINVYGSALHPFQVFHTDPSLFTALFCTFFSCSSVNNLNCRCTMFALLFTISNRNQQAFESLFYQNEDVRLFLFGMLSTEDPLVISTSLGMIFHNMQALCCHQTDICVLIPRRDVAVKVFERLLTFLSMHTFIPSQHCLAALIFEKICTLFKSSQASAILEYTISQTHWMNHLVDTILDRYSENVVEKSWKCHADDANEIFELIMKCIQHTLEWIPHSRLAFYAADGYSKVYSKIQNVNLMSDKLMERFVSMFCNFGVSSNAPVLRDTTSVASFLLLYPKFTQRHQHDATYRLRELVQSSHENITVCRQAGLLTFLLKTAFPTAVDKNHVKAIVDIIIQLVSYSLSISEAKTLFQQLKHHDTFVPAQAHHSDHEAASTGTQAPSPIFTPICYLPTIHDELLNAITIAVQADSIQENIDYFAFRQKQSYIQLPILTRWPDPTGRGYSVYINFLSSAFATDTFSQILLSMMSPFGSGEQLSIEDHSLVITVFSPPDPPISTKIVAPSVIPGKWYSLIVTHSTGIFNLTTSTVYMNGVMVWKGNAPFTKSTENVQGYVGSSVTYNTDGSCILSPSFSGYISAVALFNYVLSSEIIQTLHFGPPEDVEIQSDVYHFQLLSSQQQPLLFLTPLSVSGTNCRNLSTYDQVKLHGDATLHSVACVSVRTFANAIQCLGGLKVLYPLFCQVSFPVYECEKTIYYQSSPQERTCFVFSLITTALSQSPLLMNQFFESNGVRTISLLLQKACLSDLSFQILEEMIKMRKVCASFSQLVAAIDEYLIFEPQIWSHSSSTMLKTYFDEIQKLLLQYNELNDKFGLRFWLDAIEQHYGCFKMTGDEHHAWRFAVNLLKPPVYLDDTSPIIESLWCSIYNHASLPLYRIFLNADSLHGQTFIAKLLDSVDLDIVFRFMDSSVEMIRTLVYDWIVFVLLSDSIQYFRLQKALLDIHPSVIFGISKNYPLTKHLYECLLKLACISIDAKRTRTNTIVMQTVESTLAVSAACEDPKIEFSKSAPELSTSSAKTGFEASNCLIVNSGFLKVLLDLLVSCQDVRPEVSGQLGDDLLTIISFPANISTCRQIMSLPIMIAIISRICNSGNTGSLDETVFQMTVKETKTPVTLLKVLVCLISQPDDLSIIQTNLVEESIVALCLLLPVNLAYFIIQTLIVMLIDITLNKLDSRSILSDLDIQSLSSFASLIDQFLFHKLDILSGLKLEYGDAMYTWSSLLQQTKTIATTSSKRVSTTDLAVHTSNPFDEYPDLAKAYSTFIAKLIESKQLRPRKGYHFMWKSTIQSSDDSFIVLLVRISLNGLFSDVEDRRDFALDTLSRVIPYEEIANGEVSKSFVLYLLGNLIEADRIHSDFIPLRKCIAKLLLVWKKVVESSFPEIVNPSLDAVTSGIEKLDTFLQSEIWAVFSEKHLYSAMRNTEQEWMATVSKVTKRFVDASRLILSKAAKNADSSQAIFTTMMTKLLATAATKTEVRTRRITERIQAYECAMQLVVDQWSCQSEELGLERHIWAITTPSHRFTKLYPYENSLRMRRRLVLNKNFNTHIDASTKRDKLPPSRSSFLIKRGLLQGISAMSLHSLSDRKKLLAERIQKLQADSEFKRDSSDASMPSIDELPNDDTVGRISNDDLQVGKELIVCTAFCEMIQCMSFVKGKLRLSSTFLQFIPESTSTTSLNQSAQISTASNRPILAIDKDAMTEKKWLLVDLQHVFLRRYKLRNSGVEFFFVDGRTQLFSFFDGDGKQGSKDRNRIVRKIFSFGLPNLKESALVGPEESLKRSDLTDRWVRRDISNFEYLMALNTHSGRTYNDLTQYPVFPWILNDYSSHTIDLADPTIYRDLSKPVGALNPDRLARFLERYHSFEDPEGQVKKFLYGSHYSLPGSVLFYLLRLEPFTSLHIHLQGGKFDHPDRQFRSLDSCWHSVCTSSSDVKELIPEFFYLPEFLRNENNFDLGATQSGERLNDVVLPPWASTPEEFIRIHREALESEYVSDHLNQWIDLIWGYKQTGDAAIEAHNVFYYLTYEGSVDLNRISDPTERQSIEDQISHFGQTPSKLFFKPHPSRQKIPRRSIFLNTDETAATDVVSLATSVAAAASLFVTEAVNNLSPIGSPPSSESLITSFVDPVHFSKQLATASSTLAVPMKILDASSSRNSSVSGFIDRPSVLSFTLKLNREIPPVMIKCAEISNAGTQRWTKTYKSGSRGNSGSSIVMVDEKLHISVYQWRPSFPSDSVPMRLDQDLKGCESRLIPTVLADGIQPNSQCIDITSNGQFIFVGGICDFSLCIYQIVNISVKLSDRVYGHRDVITCVGLSEDETFLATGSRDTTVRVWPLTYMRDKCIVNKNGCRIYYGHDDLVTTVLVNRDHGIVISGSADGTLIINSLYGPPCPTSIDLDYPMHDGIQSTICDVLFNSCDATIIAHSQSVSGPSNGLSFLHVFSINGRKLAFKDLGVPGCTIQLTSQGFMVVIVDKNSAIQFLSSTTLEQVHALKSELELTSMCIYAYKGLAHNPSGVYDSTIDMFQPRINEGLFPPERVSLGSTPPSEAPTALKHLRISPEPSFVKSHKSVSSISLIDLESGDMAVFGRADGSIMVVML